MELFSIRIQRTFQLVSTTIAFFVTILKLGGQSINIKSYKLGSIWLIPVMSLL